MNCYSIEVLGKPQGKGRPRFNGKTRVAYTPERTTRYEAKVMQAWVFKYGPTHLEKPLEIDMTIFFPVNKSDGRKMRDAKINGGIKATVRPDIDNIIKIVLDALNGVAYLDDKQVVKVSASKEYGETPRVEVRIKEIEENED